MQKFTYVIAVLVAAGIAYVVATAPNQNAPLDELAPATAVSVDHAVVSQAGTMTLAVPEMHCEFSCFPRVKETLEKSDAIEQVVLAPQKEEGSIDNRQVIVHYKPGFELGDALARLDKEGFTESASVE